jgi:hypothetical protein
MGNNVPAMIMTDFLSDLRDCPDLGRRLYASINSGIDQGIPGMKLLPYHHADSTRIVAVGWNGIKPLGWVYNSTLPLDPELAIKAAIAALNTELDVIRRAKRRSA